MRSPSALCLLLLALPALGQEAPAPVAPAAERTAFQLPFPEDKGGGLAAGTAGRLELDPDKKARLTGGVELRYKDLVLKAQEIEVNLETKVVIAQGDVVIDQGPNRLTGTIATYDLETKTGVLRDATASVSPEIYFKGTELAKVAENLYTIENGTVTACTDPTPDWSFAVKRARIEMEGYAHLRGASMRVKNLPVLYVPRLIWPAKQDRAAGFLIPQPGYSTRRGASLSLAYFQTLGRSYDTTLYADLFSNSGFYGLGSELRWAPTEGSRGELSAYFIRDPDASLLPDPAEGGETLSETRWKLSLDHVADRLPFGMKGAISYRNYSDFDYTRDFERNLDRSSLRAIYSRGYATGNWGSHSLNLVIDDRQTLLGIDNVVTQRRLPEIGYRLRPLRLGRMPLYLDVDSTLSYLDLERSEIYAASYGRFDVSPNLKLPVRAFPWLALSFNGGGRYTWWSDSVCRSGTTGDQPCGDGPQQFVGEALTRAIPTASAEIIGPSFSRIFDGVGSWGKFKHVIEPRFTYSYVGEVDEDDAARVPFFNEVDFTTATNIGRVALINRLLGKPASGKGGAREILSLELARNYSFDADVPLSVFEGDRDAWGPITALLRFEPGGGTRLRYQASYNTQASVLTQQTVTAGYGWKASSAELTWLTRRNAADGERQDDQVRFTSAWSAIPSKLQLQAQLTVNLNPSTFTDTSGVSQEASRIQQQQYGLSYLSQCFGFQLSVRELRTLRATREEKERDFRFLLTLKNVGTFLDLSSRDSTADDN